MTDLLNQDPNLNLTNQIPSEAPTQPTIQPQPTLPPLPPQQPQPQTVPPQTPPVPPTQPTNDFKESITSNGKFDLNKFKELLQLYLVDKFPFALPESVKEIIVKFSPILSLIGLIFSLPLIIAYFGVSLISLPFVSVSSYGIMHYVDMARIIGTFLFEIIVLPGLFKRTKKAWNTLFYFAIFNLVFYIIDFNIANILIATSVSFYILFQCRSKYIN